MDVQSISRFSVSVIAIAMMVMSGQVSAASYKCTDLGLGAAYDINQSGQIAGTDGENAVIWNETNKTILGAGIAFGINDLGQTVGRNNNVPLLWDGGKTVALPNEPSRGPAIKFNTRKISTMPGRSLELRVAIS